MPRGEDKSIPGRLVAMVYGVYSSSTRFLVAYIVDTIRPSESTIARQKHHQQHVSCSIRRIETDIRYIEASHIQEKRDAVEVPAERAFEGLGTLLWCRLRLYNKTTLEVRM